jgi:hypothetical protein
MPSQTTRLLARLDSLEKGDGLRRAKLVGRVLFLVGLLLAAFVGVAIAYGLHPAFIAVPAAAALGILDRVLHPPRALLATQEVERSDPLDFLIAMGVNYK